MKIVMRIHSVTNLLKTWIFYEIFIIEIRDIIVLLTSPVGASFQRYIKLFFKYAYVSLIFFFFVLFFSSCYFAFVRNVLIYIFVNIMHANDKKTTSPCMPTYSTKVTSHIYFLTPRSIPANSSQPGRLLIAPFACWYSWVCLFESVATPPET